MGTGAWGYSWATLPWGYGALALQVEWWATDQQPVTIKKLSVNPNCGLRTVRLSGINLGSRKGYEMREGGSNLECGIVYEQILINAKLQIGKKGKKT